MHTLIAVNFKILSLLEQKLQPVKDSDLGQLLGHTLTAPTTSRNNKLLPKIDHANVNDGRFSTPL